MRFKYDLQHDQVIHLDLSRFSTVESGTTVKNTVEKMREENHNCTLITKGGTLIGIFTDRDILHKVVTVPEVWDAPIDTVMSKSPFTVNRSDEAQAAVTLMNEKRFRNVPVVDNNNRVAGNLTHLAIIKYVADQFPEAVYNLPPEPDRVSQHRAGG